MCCFRASKFAPEGHHTSYHSHIDINSQLPNEGAEKKAHETHKPLCTFNISNLNLPSELPCWVLKLESALEPGTWLEPGARLGSVFCPLSTWVYALCVCYKLACECGGEGIRMSVFPCSAFRAFNKAPICRLQKANMQAVSAKKLVSGRIPYQANRLDWPWKSYYRSKVARLKYKSQRRGPILNRVLIRAPRRQNQHGSSSEINAEVLLCILLEAG